MYGLDYLRAFEINTGQTGCFRLRSLSKVKWKCLIYPHTYEYKGQPFGTFFLGAANGAATVEGKGGLKPGDINANFGATASARTSQMYQMLNKVRACVAWMCRLILVYLHALTVLLIVPCILK